MSATTDNATAARSLLTIAAYAAMPFVFAVCPLGNVGTGGLDWSRMLPVLLPVVAGSVLVGAALVAAARRTQQKKSRIACAVVFAFVGPMIASLFGAILAAALSVLSLGSIANVSPYWSFVWIPLVMLQAPLLTFATSAACAVLTALLLAPALDGPKTEAADHASAV